MTICQICSTELLLRKFQLQQSKLWFKFRHYNEQLLGEKGLVKKKTKNLEIQMFGTFLSIREIIYSIHFFSIFVLKF